MPAGPAARGRKTTLHGEGTERAFRQQKKGKASMPKPRSEGKPKATLPNHPDHPLQLAAAPEAVAFLTRAPTRSRRRGPAIKGGTHAPAPFPVAACLRHRATTFSSQQLLAFFQLPRAHRRRNRGGHGKKKMNDPKYAYPYPAQGYYQGPYQGPPVMAPPQYAAAPPRREPSFLEAWPRSAAAA
uniref:Uncharacterized protein n=1 Tax=Setaria italica TaxID=4555 RepID=K4AFM7_SETIT